MRSVLRARKRPNGGRAAALPRDPLWYKTAIIYEVHVRAFCDSNGDGVGDLPGLISRLDYLQDLGVTALWLLPFYPSPLRDGGYDIADYMGIHPSYGTMADFRRLLAEAHRRGLRIITELVINHTSSDHAWFQASRRAPPGSAERELYVWSDTPSRYRSARIIFKDFESSNWSWDDVAGAYYWHRFYSHQPDLNFDNPAVHEAVARVLDFWLDLGVDGLRLDAVPYLFEREGTSCENLDETHAYLRSLRAHIDARYQDRMLLAEANQWPADAAAYFGEGDECHMNFHFPLMPRMFMAVQVEDSFPIVDILQQTPAIPEACQWATFLRNHDELTLEMVTDEERDYMYEAFAEEPTARINLGIRRRLAPLLKYRPKIELLNALLFSLPGTPVLYYGDEIGMGDNVYLGDRDGVRTPMQWSGDRNAGFSRANPQRLYLPVIIDPEYHYQAVNVEAQHGNLTSLLWWMKRIIAQRKQHPVLGTGAIEILRTNNPRVLAFVRGVGAERVLVVANLARHPQHAEIDAAILSGLVPIEVFGRTRFPPIDDAPYPLSFAPYAFYWFVLEARAEGAAYAVPSLPAPSLERALGHRASLARALAAYATECRWFRGKARVQREARITDVLAAPPGGAAMTFVVLQVDYADGEPESYFLPLAMASGEHAARIERESPHGLVARLQPEQGSAVLYDALVTGEAALALVEAMRSRAGIAGNAGRLVGSSGRALREHTDAVELVPVPSRLEQTNSTVPFRQKVILKVYRQLEPGINAEIEIGTFLTEHAASSLVPRVLGSISYLRGDDEPAALAVVHELVENHGTAWDLCLGEVGALFDRVLTEAEEAPATPPGDPLALATLEPPAAVMDRFGAHLRHARLLGRRTAEVHIALASGTSEGFRREAFTHMHQQSLYQGARALLSRTVDALRVALPSLPEAVRPHAEAMVGARLTIEARLRRITSQRLEAVRTRCHGDLHLGQVLFTGTDFVLIDFEGEPLRPLRERRYRRCPLRDVAGMIRSFSYAAESALRDGQQRPSDGVRLAPWARLWASYMSAEYVGAYLALAGPADLLPPSEEDRKILLEFYTLEKCIYEVRYELNNRPAWLTIPLAGLLPSRDRGGPPAVAGDAPSPPG